MKNNRSLAVSTEIAKLKKANILGFLEKEFPDSRLEAFEPENSRNRVFTPIKTLKTMVFTAVQEDKTLKNAVNQYYFIHQHHRREAQNEIEQKVKVKKNNDRTITKRKPGRPEKVNTSLSKSLEKDVSLNTAAFTKARQRVPLAMIDELFKTSLIQDASNTYTHFLGYEVFMGDGTYVQLQDTKAITGQYPATSNSNGYNPYPQGLLEVITARGTGQIHSFKLANRKSSELPLFYDMIDDLPPNSLLLLDDLYNCYEIIAKCKRKGVALLIPAKRERKHKVVEVLGEGDEIIKVKTPKTRSKWAKEHEPPKDIFLRRIECVTPEGKSYVLHTTILEKTIKKEALQVLYQCRWDIEISIREIKTILNVNILRAKTPDMALKELTVALATYNLLRKIIYASVKNLPFSPKGDFIYEYYTLNKDILVDKKGRVYNRWSPGRKGAGVSDKKASTAKKTTK